MHRINTLSKKLFTALIICVFLSFSVQKARAFFDETGYFAVAAAAAAGSSGAITAAAGTAGTLFGLTPIGWIGIGTLIVATLLISADTESPTGKTAVLVSTQSIEDDPNPDLNSGGHVFTTVSDPVVFALKTKTASPYLYFNRNNCYPGGIFNSQACHGGIAYPTAHWMEFQDKLKEYFQAQYGIELLHAFAVHPNSTTAVDCNTTPSSASYSGTGRVCVRVVFPGPQTVLSTSLFNWTLNSTNPPTFSAVVRTENGSPIDCDLSVSYFDYTLQTCVLKTAVEGQTLDDGVCRVSFANDGNPVMNPFDPDCARAKSNMQLTLSPGTPTAAPKVTATDPETYTQIETARPAIPAQGNPGAVSVKQRVADPVNNTTRENQIQTQPTQPGNPPAASGSANTTYPGTGTNTSTTPAQSVQVSNWPDVLNVNCTNCTPPPINIPDRMKIDGEIPAGEEAEPIAPEFQETTTLLDPLKQRMEGFTNFQFPQHTSSCPRLDIAWSAWNLNVNASSNTMCEFLAEHRTLFQSLMMFAYIAAAIIIVLGA